MPAVSGHGLQNIFRTKYVYVYSPHPLRADYTSNKYDIGGHICDVIQVQIAQIRKYVCNHNVRHSTASPQKTSLVTKDSPLHPGRPQLFI